MKIENSFFYTSIVTYPWFVDVVNSDFMKWIIVPCSFVFLANTGDYKITIYTAHDGYSGTNAIVKIRLYGKKGISKVYTFPHDKNHFEKNRYSNFVITRVNF